MLKALFKSTGEKASECQALLNQIADMEKDVKNFEVIAGYLSLYIAEIAIPSFKSQKFANYMIAMSSFCTQEVENARNHMECWSEFLQVINKVQQAP